MGPGAVLLLDPQTPSTLLALFWPGLLCKEAKGASRVLPPRTVLKVVWTVDDTVTPHPVVSESAGNRKIKGGRENEGEEHEGVDSEGETVDEKGQEQGGKEDEDDKEEEEDKEDEEHGEEQGVEKVERGPVTVCDIDISKIRWPEGVREIILTRFNRPVSGVVWPTRLEILAFHTPPGKIKQTTWVLGMIELFNRPLDGVTFPAGLREIHLGQNFNQNIDGVAWPEGLERLSLPGFNQPIHGVQWPPGLETLEFGQPEEFERRGFLDNESEYEDIGVFDQPLGTFLPINLKTLWLSDRFNQFLRDVTWQSGLTVLGLGRGLTAYSVGGVRWPPMLQKLAFSDANFDVEDPPSGCRVVNFGPIGAQDSDPNDYEIDPMNDVDAADY